METCLNCSKIILSDYRFCPRCGYSLYGDTPTISQEGETPNDTSRKESWKQFFEFAQSLGEAENIDILLQKIGDAVEKILGSERSSTLLLDDTGTYLFFKVASGVEALKKLKIPVDQGIAGWIATNQKGVIVNNPYSDERFSPEADKATGFRTTSIAGVPLILRGRLIGVCEAINKKSGGFTEEDLRVLTGFAGLASVSIANIRLQTEHKNLYSNLLEFLVMAAESLGSPESTPKGHAWDMAQMATQMARELGMSASKQKLLQHAALVHDIGFLGLDHSRLIGLDIPNDLTDNMKFRLHTIIGGEMLKGIKFMQKLIPPIIAHHRYRNGEGFPENFPVEKITLESEILSILEDFVTVGSIEKINPERYSPQVLQALKKIIS